jgi:hypothetical protein
VADGGQGSGQSGLLRIDEVAQQVQLAPAVLGGDLNAGDDLQRGAGRGGAGGLDGGEGVVVGDGDSGEAGPAGQLDDLLGGVGAVAGGRVQVQVGAAGGGAPGELLAEVGERLACGHASLHLLGLLVSLSPCLLVY